MSTNPTTNTNVNSTSLVGAHVQYVKGAVEEAIGSVTGSQPWAASGANDKAAGVDAMKAASANRNPERDGFGRVEEIAGKLSGCEGMEREGAESKPHAQ